MWATWNCSRVEQQTRRASGGRQHRTGLDRAGTVLTNSGAAQPAGQLRRHQRHKSYQRHADRRLQSALARRAGTSRPKSASCPPSSGPWVLPVLALTVLLAMAVVFVAVRPASARPASEWPFATRHPPDPAGHKMAPRSGGVSGHLAYAGAKGLHSSALSSGPPAHPADFGLVALASLVTEYLGTVHTWRGRCLHQQNDPEAANATFVISTGSAWRCSPRCCPVGRYFSKSRKWASCCPCWPPPRHHRPTAVNDALSSKPSLITDGPGDSALVKARYPLIGPGRGRAHGRWCGAVIGTLAQHHAVLISP